MRALLKQPLIFDGRNLFDPVSYTHLDVYKRQVTARAISAATRREFFMMGFLIDNKNEYNEPIAEWLTG